MERVGLIFALSLCLGLSATASFAGIIVGGGGGAKSIEASTLEELATIATSSKLIEIEGKKFRPGFVDFDNKRILLHAEDGGEDLLLHGDLNEMQDHLIDQR